MEESRWSGMEYIPLVIIFFAVIYCIVTILLNHILFWILTRFFHKSYSEKIKNRTLYIIVATGIILFYLF